MASSAALGGKPAARAAPPREKRSVTARFAPPRDIIAAEPSAERSLAAEHLSAVVPDGPSLEDLRAALMSGRQRPEATPRKRGTKARAHTSRPHFA